jgi:hypothetical protein
MRTGVEGSRRVRLAAASALVVSLLGGAVVVLFSDESTPPPAALKPVPSAPTTQPREAPAESDSSTGMDFGLGAEPSAAGVGSADTSALAGQGGTLPNGGSAVPLPAAPALPALQLPSLPELPSAPTIDWAAALAPYIQSQANATAANLAGSITGTAVGSGTGALNSAAIALGDLILFAAYSNNGQAMLSQLPNAVPAAQSAAAALPPPDFSGLSTAFAAAAVLPPVGVPAPQLPLAPQLPTPEQAAAALAVLPAIGLSALPPPPIGLPALPPPPPIGLPPIGLPSIGLPSIGLPSITRLFGLPF